MRAENKHLAEQVFVALQRLPQDNRIEQCRAWMLLGWVTAERSCPCKQSACPAVGGGSEVSLKPLVPRLSVRKGFLALTSPGCVKCVYKERGLGGEYGYEDYSISEELRSHCIKGHHQCQEIHQSQFIWLPEQSVDTLTLSTLKLSMAGRIQAQHSFSPQNIQETPYSCIEDKADKRRQVNGRATLTQDSNKTRSRGAMLNITGDLCFGDERLAQCSAQFAFIASYLLKGLGIK
ncbi:hypothetical protein J6590_078962 [Homalodisca vitripennis]|nr:hypothetical protein J6590_078962 [Homalodisca vitripennis]